MADDAEAWATERLDGAIPSDEALGGEEEGVDELGGAGGAGGGGGGGGGGGADVDGDGDDDPYGGGSSFLEDAATPARAARKAAYRAARAAEAAARAGGGGGGGGGEGGPASVAAAEAEKEAGNKAYNGRRFEEAIECYTRALSLLPSTAPARLPALRGAPPAAAAAAPPAAAAEEGAAAAAVAALPPAEAPAPPIPACDLLRCVCLSNRAAVSTSLERWGAVLADCDRALELNPAFAKALRRRAAALERLHLLDEAEADCKRLLGSEFEAQLPPRDAEQLRGDLARLEELRKARDAKLAEDMLGKLKEMGNGLLKSAWRRGGGGERGGAPAPHLRSAAARFGGSE